MAPWPKGIRTVTLFVEDLQASKRFYQDAFGLPVTFEDASSVVFRFGDTLINLLATWSVPELIGPATMAKREAGARVELTIEVDDVDATCEDLARRGVTLLNGPIDRPWGLRTASFTDLDGHIWEIAH